MRYLLSRIHGFFTGGNAKLACCAFCGLSYQKVGPLVEGEASCFACGHCLRKLSRRSKADDKPLAALDADLTPTERELPLANNNPFAPPSTHIKCSFCGELAEGTLQSSPLSTYFICSSCVEQSITLIDAELARKGLASQ